MHRGGEPLEDLEQVAAEGLVLALDRFEPDRGVPFPAFAKPTIVGSLKRHFRDLGWAVRVPRQVHELASPFREVVTGCPASSAVRPPRARWPAARRAARRRSTRWPSSTPRRADASSFEPAPSVTKAADGGPLDTGRPDAPALAEDRIELHRALEGLDERDREVLGRYFFQEESQSVIAEVVRRQPDADLPLDRLRAAPAPQPDADVASLILRPSVLRRASVGGGAAWRRTEPVLGVAAVPVVAGTPRRPPPGWADAEARNRPSMAVPGRPMPGMGRNISCWWSWEVPPLMAPRLRFGLSTSNSAAPVRGACGRALRSRERGA